MTAEHALSCLLDERKYSVDTSECLDDAKKQFPSWIPAMMMLMDLDNPSKPTYSFALPAHITNNFQAMWEYRHTSDTASHHPWR